MKPEDNESQEEEGNPSSSNESTLLRPINIPSTDPPSTATMKPQTTTDQSSEDVVRGTLGQGMTSLSDLVNNNLLAFRYGTVATVTLLTAYGLANTPLFFRYKSVAEIPAKLFTSRKRLRARLIQTTENDQAGQPLQLYVRHLSPVGTVLSKNLFDMVAKMAPSAQVHKDGSDWIKVEIAGVSAPPFYAGSSGYRRGEWLTQLAKEKTMVQLQLLGRRVATKDSSSSSSTTQPTKRDVTNILPEVESTLKESSSTSSDEEQVAVCRLYYRPSLFQVFATDIADPLVRYGHASVESEMFLSNEHTKNSRVLDASVQLNDIRKDVNYLDRLGKLEYEAAKGSYGMWSDTLIRDKRRDIVEEVEFQTNATVWQKVWRWMRG